MNAHVQIDAIRDIAAAVRAMLGDDFDEQTYLDTVDGETDAMDLLGNLIQSRVEARETAAAMKHIASIYTARAKRLEAQAEAYTTGMGKLLDALGERQVKHPIGTVSRTKPRESAKITDPTQIPSQLYKRVVDEEAVKAAVKAGETVPGAELVKGQPGISVRIR